MTDLSERAEQGMTEAWRSTAAGQKGMRMSLDFRHGFWAAREYSKQREEKLREVLDYLAEAIGRVEYRGQAGDVEDVDNARHDAVAALAENGDSDA